MNRDDSPEAAAIPALVLEQLEQHLVSRRSFLLGSYKDSYVRRRVALRIRATGCSSAEQYLGLLRGDNGELDLLVKALNVHVSQFFRNLSTFEILRDEILPRLFTLVEQEGRAQLRLWSVGCAGGEEPYTLALMMHHYFPRQLNDGKISLLATDVDAGILDAAQVAGYRAERLSELPGEMLPRYFRQEGSMFYLEPEVKSLVTFRQADLFQPDAFSPADLILCRNVLIYFEQWQQARIIDRFAEVLPSGGFLVLGRAETLSRESRRNFETVHPLERIYRRR